LRYEDEAVFVGLVVALVNLGVRILIILLLLVPGTAMAQDAGPLDAAPAVEVDAPTVEVDAPAVDDDVAPTVDDDVAPAVEDDVPAVDGSATDPKASVDDATKAS
jgi:hypothetical protein